MIVDIHVHAGTLEQWNPELVSSWFEPFGLSTSLLEVSTDALVRRMDKSGITKSVLLAFNCKRHLGVHIPNEYIADLCRENPHRFVGFASFDPIDYAATDEVQHAKEVLGLVGVKLSPTYQDVDPAHPRFISFLQRCAELEMPVLIHHGFTGNRLARSKYQQAWQIDEMMTAVPNLKMIVAHMGMPAQEEVMNLMVKHQGLFADISARDLTSYGGGIPQLGLDILRAKEFDICSKLLWGSDTPFVAADESLSNLRSLIGFTMPGRPEISAEDVDQILGKNAINLIPELNE